MRADWKSDLTDVEMREHLARNYSNPTHGPTQEEELMRLIRRVNAKVDELTRKHGADKVAQPGTAQWDSQVLQKLVTSLQRKNYSYSTILHTAPGVELVRNMDKFAFFRGEGVIRVKDLQALLVGANRARGDVSAIGAVSCLLRLGGRCSFRNYQRSSGHKLSTKDSTCFRSYRAPWSWRRCAIP